jgi:hypothetical protein
MLLIQLPGPRSCPQIIVMTSVTVRLPLRRQAKVLNSGNARYEARRTEGIVKTHFNFLRVVEGDIESRKRKSRSLVADFGSKVVLDVPLLKLVHDLQCKRAISVSQQCRKP